MGFCCKKLITGWNLFCSAESMVGVRLNEDQRAALAAVKAGENIFLTGPAGSGKTTLIQAILGWAATVERRCEVTALTGCAALLLGNRAKTLHSWAGIGLGRETADVLATAILKSPFAKKRWKRTDTLIIDEISMMTPELFEKLDLIGRKVRGCSTKPWGGIQLILAGDFFQLPPINKGFEGPRYAFDSPAWMSACLKPVLLKRIERQTDSVFQTLLNEARVGTLSAESIAILKSRQHLNWKEQRIRPTLLFSRNADVDSINETNVSALKKPIHIFDARTVVDRADEHGVSYADIPEDELLERLVQRMDTDSSYCPHLELCEGCQVMLLYNRDLEAGLVNGSRGVVVGFRHEDGFPIVQFLHGDPVVIDEHEWKSNDSPCLKRVQVPLRVAYAVTIHKSQGATLDCALVDIGSSTFECGQAYVALSRVRDLESLFVWNFQPARVRADPRVLKFYEDLESPPPTPPPSVPPTPPPSPISPPPSPESSACTDDRGIHESWTTLLETWESSDAGKLTLQKVADARGAGPVFPADKDLYAALQVPMNAVRVVIVAQDPYSDEGLATGFAYSIPSGQTLPPALRNIRKEIQADLGTDVWNDGASGDLSRWVKQGVLLLNASLTVKKGEPGSHTKIGWQILTRQILEAVLRENPNVVVMVWGKFAQNLLQTLKFGERQHLLEASHPSPFTASRGFFGCRHFSRANSLLAEPIEW